MTRLVCLALLSLTTVAAPAQAIRMGAPRPRPNSLLGNTLITLSVSPSGVTFALAAGTQTNASSSIAITSTLTNPLLTTVTIYGFFSSAAAALTGTQSGVNIPTSNIYGLVSTGVPTSYTAFTQSNALGGSGTSLKLVYVTGLAIAHTQTDNLSLRIDLSSQPQLPADSYTGTLILQAQIF